VAVRCAAAGQQAVWRLACACIVACMVALQIRDVPEDLRDRLAELARQRGQSLQAYLFDVLSDEARRQDNLAVLDRFGKGAYGSRLSAADISDALRAGRAERDSELDAGIDPDE
jgi:antitoxin FitA